MNSILMLVLEAAKKFGPVVARTTRQVVADVLDSHPELRVAPKDLASEVADVHARFLGEVAERFPDTEPGEVMPVDADWD